MEVEVRQRARAFHAFRSGAQKQRSNGASDCAEETCVYEEEEVYGNAAWVPFSWEERPGVPLLVGEQSYGELEALTGKKESRGMAGHHSSRKKAPALPFSSENDRSHGLLFPLPPPPTPSCCASANNSCSSSPSAAAPHLSKPSSDPARRFPVSPLSFESKPRASSFPPFLEGSMSPDWPAIPSALEDDPFLRAIQACTQSRDCIDGCGKVSSGSKERAEALLSKHRNAAHLRAMAKEAGITGANTAKSGATLRAVSNAENRRVSESNGGSRALAVARLVKEAEQRKGVKGKEYEEGHADLLVAGFEAQPGNGRQVKARGKEGRRHQRSSSSAYGWGCRSLDYQEDSIVRVQNSRGPAP